MDYYGSQVPLDNVANVTTPDARTIAIVPWEKSMFKVIEKALIDSNVGIMPENNGEVIRLNIPPLTEERRKQLVKDSKAESEKGKVSVRLPLVLAHCLSCLIMSLRRSRSLSQKK